MSKWIQAHATNTKVGDVVKVKDDAFSEPKVADAHNGRICEVLEVRGGDFPAQSRYVAAVVLLASIADAPRVTNLLEIAKETKATSERIDEENVLKLCMVIAD